MTAAMIRMPDARCARFWNGRNGRSTPSSTPIPMRDHIGGNKYLMQQTGCRIYASSMEAAFTRHPILEPAFLYGGYPFKDLRHKFLMAQESDVSDVSRLSEDQLLKDLELIPLPGHFSR